MQTIPLTLRAVGNDLLAIVWPTACAGCGLPDRTLCDSCRLELRRASPILRCDLGLPCFVRSRYEGPLRGALVAFKHGGSTGFARELGAQLRLPLRAAIARCRGPGAPVLVCVPSRPSRVRERGYRHMHLLLRMALRGPRDGRVPVLSVAALRTTRGRTGQVGLRAAERERNASRIAVRRRVRSLLVGREVVLVDDVITTGATILAARAALESVGATVVAAAALCGAERRDTRAAEERWRALKRVQ